MPRKIDFSVIHVTSEDTKFKFVELNAHGPTVRGWQSEKNSTYPQEIIVKFAKRCTLTKVQVLAHQYLIPSKLELFASNQDTNTVEDINEIEWDYLGYITLSDNQSAGFKSRELKSVNVPTCDASYLKLSLGKNHPNSYNNNNQVSLIAINILGNELGARKSSTLETIADKLNAIVNNSEYFSPYDDLSFEMYVDVDVCKIIKEMEMKKHVAVLNERFEYARKLKLTMEQLRTAGEKLGKYDLEKRHAIEMENYERARQKKTQIDQFRTTTYNQLNVEQLLENDGICVKNDECEEGESSLKLPGENSNSPSNPLTGSVSPLHNTKYSSPKTTSPSTGSPTSLQGRSSFRRRNKSAGAIVKSSYEQYEEKPLPTLRHSQTNEFLRECQMENDAKTSSKLTEREKKQAALPILVFGVDLVENFYSKHYLDKEDGLNRLKEQLINYDQLKMHPVNKIARASIFLLHRALRDKVFSVYNLANEVIRLFFVQFSVGRVSSAEVGRSVDKLLPELLTKSGDTSTRIHHMAVHTILTMADCNNVRELHIIPSHLSRNLNSTTHPRLALSRAEMLEQLIINHGISTDKQSGLTCRTLAEFGLSGLHHSAEGVRKVAERILVLVYKVNPRLVRKQLPPDDGITRRNLLYRQLFHEFDLIDIQRKKELMERNRLIQQCTFDCFSPEPQRNPLNKSVSTSDVKNAQNPNYTLTKSISGGNIMQTNDDSDKQSTSNTPNSSNNSQNEEKHCIFCRQSETIIFASNKSMNSHYWRTCPMLIRCIECSQVVEVATLYEHQLVECEQHERFTQCPQCTEAVKIDEFKQHATQCIELTEGCNRCPLCHLDIEDEDNCWFNHLMGEKSCGKNTRIKHQKQVTIMT